MAPSHPPLNSSSSLDSPSLSVSSDPDLSLSLPQKTEQQRLSFGIPVLDSARFRLSHDVRVFSPKSRVRLAFFPYVPNTCCTHAFSQFARLVRSSSTVSSKSTRTGGTTVSFHFSTLLLEPSKTCWSLDVFYSLCSHRAHTHRARCPQTMRTSPTLGCLFTPSTSTPTTCLLSSLNLPRTLFPVAPRFVLPLHP